MLPVVSLQDSRDFSWRYPSMTIIHGEKEARYMGT